jgi:superfamily II DNA or RNA helicase
MSLNRVTPEDILKIVKFNIEQGNQWKYDKNSKDMYTYQAEGSAGLWNRLEHYGVAILADEVGMGKTYQALAVVAKQYKIKSDSKVLIIAPRVEVLRQWKDEEYGQFRDNHIQDETSLPDNEYLDELQNLENGFNPKNKQIVFAKTTSFSQNVDIQICQESLKQFDLVIIDEAHKFRNYDVSSDENNYRTSNASKIFEDSNCKTLLMTATPLHSKKSDILNVVSVFRKDILNFQNENKTSETIMKYLMVRRLRVVSNKGLNKYDYRKEIEVSVDLKSVENDYKDELFFALLQKKLIEKEGGVDFSKSKHLLDLLEGTTFNEEHNNENKKESTPLDKVFKIVVDKFFNSYKTYPSNQKYNCILNAIWKSEEKALVFVRRRASAIELARQYIEEFDERAWKLLSDVKRIPKRESFDRVLGLKNIDSRVDEFIEKNFILDYFKEYKELVKLPKGTRDTTIKKNMANNFFDEFDKVNKENMEKFIKKFQEHEKVDDASLVKSKVLDFFKTKKHEDSTEASRFVRKFDKGRAYDKFFEEFLPNQFKYNDNQKGLIKSAILHASIGVIELFKCDIKTKNYDSFCKKVLKILPQSKLKKEIESFLENFDKYKKYLSLNNIGDEDSEEDIVNLYDEKIFHNAQPVYAYLSNTKNKNVIARFNSPFFPNMLCGTSTLQEGLNLHLQCNKVYHFGSAHSMGDDEQRTGRVDRVHGKMHRELNKSKDAKLHIYYPYLRNTFDEENLRGMLCSKRYTEKKIDNCQIEANVESNTQQVCEKPIKELISNGNGGVEQTEPFEWRIYNYG